MKYLFLFLFILSACQKKDETPPQVVETKEEVVSILGTSTTIRASDLFQDVETMPILTNKKNPIPDGVFFRVQSPTLLISDNSTLWLKDIVVSSLSGKVKFSVKPNTTPGVYQIFVYPIIDPSLSFSFSKNISARFYIEVKTGIPTVISDIKSELFEDKSPYNGIKDSNESWIIPSATDQLTYLSVGPIKDSFGNNLNDGQIQLTVSEGLILSENPVPISDGYAFFSYQPSGTTNDLTASAAIQGISGVSLIKNVSMKLAKPKIELISGGDFTGMSLNESRTAQFVIKNTGSLPITNLNITTNQPYVLESEISGSCHERGSLKSQESCFIKVSYTRTSSLTQNGTIQIISQPSTFSGTSLNIPLLVSNVEPTRLVPSESVISFDQISCGESSSREIYITNTGSFDAQNVNLTQPVSTVVGQQSYFTLRLPPADPNPSQNVSDIINCGNVFPAGRKCRVFIDFNPQTLMTTPAPVIGLVNADSTPSISLSINGSSKAGPPSGEFPVNFYKFGTQTVTSSIYAQNGQKISVRVGPVLDSCGLPVVDGNVVSAIVSAGSLSSLIATTSNGYADFTWNAITSSSSIGTQSIVISTDSFSKLSNITFQGVLLSISGPTNLGQVLIENPQDFVYTLTNNGNIRADGLTFNPSSPLILKDIGTCQSGITSNESCTFTVRAQPNLNQDLNLSINATSTSFGVNSANLSNILLSSRNKPLFTSNLSKLYFSDGSSNSSILKTITITNSGPAIAYGVSVSVESPYSLNSSNCPQTMNVNESCNVSVSVSRTSSIGAGVKNLTIGYEFESTALVIPMTYSDLIWSNPTYSLKKYFCAGPYQISTAIDNGSLVNVSQSTSIDLSSTSGSILFFNDSTCLNKITSTTISNGNSTSSNIYIRSINSGNDQLLANSLGFSQTIRAVSFSDISNDLLSFKPALAIKNMACVLCHSNIKGNIITDFGLDSSASYNHLAELSSMTPTNSGTGDQFSSASTEWAGINGSNSFGTSYIEGTIFTPKVSFVSSDKTKVQNLIVNNLNGVYDSSTPTVLNTIADYLNSILPHRTASYLSYLKNYSNTNYSSINFTKDNRINPYNISIRELKNVSINSISSNQIISFLDFLSSYKYYKWTASSSDLLNFGLRYGNFYGNDPTQVMSCEGDLFVDGPVYLKDLQLSTSTGCRIYATGTVFIEAPDASVSRAGISFVNPTASSNIQIASAKGIMLGMGQSSINDRKTRDTSTYNGGVLISTMDSDVLKIKDNSNTPLLKDAANSGSRIASFSRILLNAPRIDSRYRGDFSGVIISKFAVFSLGQFTYLYDSTFNSVPILPLIDSSTFFSVQDCITGNIDQAVVKDSNTNYRSCFP